MTERCNGNYEIKSEGLQRRQMWGAHFLVTPRQMGTLRPQACTLLPPSQSPQIRESDYICEHCVCIIGYLHVVPVKSGGKASFYISCLWQAHHSTDQCKLSSEIVAESHSDKQTGALVSLRNRNCYCWVNILYSFHIIHPSSAAQISLSSQMKIKFLI